MALTAAAARAKSEQELNDFFALYVVDGSRAVSLVFPVDLEIPLGLHDYNPAVPVRFVLTADQMKGQIRLAVTPGNMPQSTITPVIGEFLCTLSEKLVLDPINPLRDRMVVVGPGIASLVVVSALPRTLQLMYDADPVNPFKPTAEFVHLYINILLGFCVFPLRSMGLALRMKLIEFVCRAMHSLRFKVKISRVYGPGCQYISGIGLIHDILQYADRTAGVVHED